MRVLHVDTGREWRGGQVQLLHLLRGATDAAVAAPPDAPIGVAARRAGVEVFAVPFRGALTGTRALRAAVARFRPELVAAHTSHAHGHALRAADGPVIVHRRVDFRPGPLSAGKYRAARGYVAVSRAVAAVLVGAGVPGDRVEVVPDGVVVPEARADPGVARAELGLDPQDLLVLAIGALVDHKGHIHLVRALPQLPARVHVAILGEGPRRGRLAREARRLGVAARLHLVGRRDDVGTWLRACDVFAHPSVEEGFGQVVVEAMGCGAPVVASAAGGLPEVVGTCGRLVPPGDAVALAGAIRSAAADPGDLAAARERAARFSVAAMVEGTEAAYARLSGA